MGQQHRKIIKRRRRADYLKRKKELAATLAIKPRFRKVVKPVETEVPAAGEAPVKKAPAKKAAKKAATKADATES